MTERKLNNRVSNAVIGALLVISLCLLTFPALSDEVFKFKNPSFSGIGTGAHYLTIENQEFSREKAIKDAIAAARKAAEREAQFQPFTQLGLIGQQLAQIQPGAFPTQTVGYAPPAAPASPLATALGVGTGIASIGSKLGIFG